MGLVSGSGGNSDFLISFGKVLHYNLGWLLNSSGGKFAEALYNYLIYFHRYQISIMLSGPASNHDHESLCIVVGEGQF